MYPINRNGTGLYSSLEKAGFIISRCERGTILLEMVASMSILLIVLTSILPQAILLLQERKNTKLWYNANAILKEQIAIHLYDTVLPEAYKTNIADVMYTIHWESLQEQGGNQVCIQWYNASKQLQMRCLHVRKEQV